LLPGIPAHVREQGKPRQRQQLLAFPPIEGKAVLRGERGQYQNV